MKSYGEFPRLEENFSKEKRQASHIESLEKNGFVFGPLSKIPYIPKASASMIFFNNKKIKVKKNRNLLMRQVELNATLNITGSLLFCGSLARETTKMAAWRFFFSAGIADAETTALCFSDLFLNFF